MSMPAGAPAASFNLFRALAAALLAAAFAAAPRQAHAADVPAPASETRAGIVQGSVTGSDGKPASGARIQLADGAGKPVAGTQSDAQGRFSIAGVAPGRYTVSAAGSGGVAASAPVQVAPGGTGQARLALGAKELEAVTVTARRFERARNNLSPSTGSSQYSFSEKAIDKLPEGDHTPFNRVLLQAPGVANDSFGQVHVRGDHNDLQYRINGIILPDGVNGFGQVFDTRFAKSITLNTGALPAQYGLRTAGVIDIATKDRFDGGDVDLYGGSHDTFNPGFQLGKTSGPFSAYVTGQFLSGNLGVENPTSSSTAIHDRTQQGKGFGYFSYLLSPHTKLSAVLAATGTRLEIPNNPGQAPNPDFVGQLNASGEKTAGITSAGLDERQYERNQYGIVALQGVGAGDINYQLAVFDRISTVEFAPDPLGDLAFNGDAARIKRKASALGLQGDLSVPLGESHRLGAGVSATTEDDRADNSSTVFTVGAPAALPPACAAGQTLSGDAGACYGGPVRVVDNNPKNGNTLLSLYLQDKWDLSDSLTVNYGLRYDKVNAFTSGSQVSPRIGMIDYLTPRITLHAGYARYFTPPPNELVAGRSLARFAGTTNDPAYLGNSTRNDGVRPERSHYFDAGVTWQAGAGLSVGLDGYYRYARNLIDEGQFGQALIFTPFNYDTGHVYGLELSGTYRRGNFSGYLNLARSLAQGTNIVSGQFNFSQQDLDYLRSHYIYLDHDQGLTGSGGISYLWCGTTFGIDGTYGSGLRSTPAGFAPNAGKLRPNLQFDFSASRTLRVSEGFGDLGLRVAVLNVLDRDNQIRSGTGIGVGAPQFGPRAALYFGITKPFGAL
ncbi:MAG: TonB-dependent receptor [Nevskia sp.]|nr:TonB-dependent receptor [Nevskia sp.]